MQHSTRRMTMKKVEDLFAVEYGTSFGLNALTPCSAASKYAVNFVARTSKNNGVTSVVERIADVEPLPAGTLTVAVGGSVLETFLQPAPYYTGFHVLTLVPKTEMSDEVKLYYCACIRANRYRYSYGRQANKTLRDILIPDLQEVSRFVGNSKIPDYSGMMLPLENKKTAFDTALWKEFRYDMIFDVKKGKRVTKFDLKPGDTPFLSAVDKNNGIREFAGLTPLFDGNAITVNYNGSVGEAFYQDKPFWASDDINVLVPKFQLNKYIAMFLTTLIRHEKYRFNYGRKWYKERMEEHAIKLPANPDGTPDFNFMEQYIKSLPYSAAV